MLHKSQNQKTQTKPNHHDHFSFPKGVLQLPLHCLDVGILDKELGAELAELGKLNLAGAVLVDLLQNLHQLLLARSEAHRSQNLIEIVGRQELLLLRVEQVEAGLEAFDLVGFERGRLVDLLEIDPGIGVRFEGHCVAVVCCVWCSAAVCCGGGGAGTVTEDREEGRGVVVV